MRKIVGAKYPLKLLEPVQLDVGAMNPVCRPATDIYLFDTDSFPPKALEAINKSGILLEEAVFIFRMKEYWRIGLSTVSARQFHKSLVEAGFIRCDFNTCSFGYAKLMRAASINSEYVASLEEIDNNSKYEKCKVPDIDEMKRMDLRIRNRLNERQQRIIRMYYGLDGKVFSVRQIAEVFKNDPIDEELAEKYPKAALLKAWSNKKHGRIMAAKNEALAVLAEEKRDDRHEYIGKLLADLYNLAWGKDTNGKAVLKDFDEAEIAEYLHEIGLIRSM